MQGITSSKKPTKSQVTMLIQRYPQFAEDMVVMGLTIDDSPPTLTVLKEQYNKLSLLRHQDKNPPKESQKFTELFQNLGNSYQRLRQHVFDNTDVNQISGEFVRVLRTKQFCAVKQWVCDCKH